MHVKNFGWICTFAIALAVSFAGRVRLGAQIQCEINCIQTNCFAIYTNSAKQCYVPIFKVDNKLVPTFDATGAKMHVSAGLGGGTNQPTTTKLSWYKVTSCNVQCEPPGINKNGSSHAGNCATKYTDPSHNITKHECKGGS